MASKESDIAHLENMCIRYNKEISTDKKTKKCQNWQTATKEANESEAQYKARVAEYNSFLEKYYHRLKKINELFQKHEESRIESIKEATFKILLFDLDSIRNYQFDLEQTIKSLKIVEAKKDIHEFIKENKESVRKEFYPRAFFHQYNSFYQQSITETLAKMNDSNINEKDELLEGFRKEYEKLILSVQNSKKDIEIEAKNVNNEDISNLKFLANMFNESWRGESIDPSVIKKFEEIISNKLIMKAWILAFQQYRLSGRFILNDSGYSNITKLLIIVLNECVRIKEVIITKKIVILSLTFYKIIQIPGANGQNKEEKIFLQVGINFHPIWKDLDFWDSAIFLSIKDEILSKKNYKLDQKEDDSDILMRQKNLVFGQLASYGHNMLIFNMDKSDVKSLLQKYFKFYNLTETQIKDISGTLDFATKQNENIQKLLKYLKDTLKQKSKILEDNGLRHMNSLDKDWEVISGPSGIPSSPKLAKKEDETNNLNKKKVIKKTYAEDSLLKEDTREDLTSSSHNTSDIKSQDLKDEESKSEDTGIEQPSFDKSRSFNEQSEHEESKNIDHGTNNNNFILKDQIYEKDESLIPQEF